MTAPTLTEFLRARIAEDEAEARSAAVLSQGVDRISTHSLPEFADHMTRWQPSRVLAECDAKRYVVGLHGPAAYADVEELYCATCRVGPFEQTTGWPCATLRAIALPYADHPDYNPGWKP